MILKIRLYSVDSRITETSRFRLNFSSSIDAEQDQQLHRKLRDQAYWLLENLIPSHVLTVSVTSRVVVVTSRVVVMTSRVVLVTLPVVVVTPRNALTFFRSEVTCCCGNSTKFWWTLMIIMS